MAKVKRNVLVDGMSGTIGKGLVFRQMRDGSTIVSAKPDFSNRKFSNGQLTHQGRFQQAAAYARQAAKTNPIYAELAKGTTKTAYNIALSDWFNPPVIHSLKRQGTRIQVDTYDNVMVTKVLVTILDEQGKTLEQGQAMQVKNPWWEYPTASKGKVRVDVWDLAGNVVRGEI